MGKKEDIFSAAHALFSAHGFKPVGISDISKAAGISVGSFYNYYASKEAVFLEVYAAENQKVKQDITGALDTSLSPIDIVQQFFRVSMDTTKHNRILAEWYGEHMGEQIRAHFRSGASASSLRAFTTGMIDTWRAQRVLRDDISSEDILAIYDALAYLDIHANRAESVDFSRSIVLLAKFTAMGIICEKEC